MDKPTKVTPQDLVSRIEIEGLSYAVQHYYGRNIECAEDPTFEVLWKAAFDAIEALEKHARNYERE